MKVNDIMTREIAVCHPHSSVAEATQAMWQRDCGCVPVVRADGQVAGMITDRDIAIAVATKGRTADRIEVGEVITGQVFACAPGDTVERALEIMRDRRVRRLPVLDEQGHLKGLLSMNDLVLHASRRKDGVPSDAVLQTLQAICRHESAIAHA